MGLPTFWGCVFALVFTTSSLVAGPFAKQVFGELRKPLPRGHRSALALLKDPTNLAKMEEEIRSLWKAVHQHVDNRAEEILALEEDQGEAFYQIAVELYVVDPEQGAAGIFSIAPILPDYQEDFAALLFEREFTVVSQIIDGVLERDDGQRLLGLLPLLAFLGPEKDLRYATTWLKKAIASRHFEQVEEAAKTIAKLISLEVPVAVFSGLDQDLYSFCESIHSGGNHRLRSFEIGRFGDIALASALLSGPSKERLKIFQDIYRRRGEKQLSVLATAKWMNALNLLTGRPTHPVDQANHSKEQLDIIIANLKTLASSNADWKATYRRNAGIASQLLLGVEDSQEARSYLQALMTEGQSEVFQRALAKHLAALPDTEDLLRKNPECVAILGLAGGTDGSGQKL